MNRLHQLQKTLPDNIRDSTNLSEFVLLNYNSEDDMDLWVKSELGEYLRSGKLNYYRTFDPKKFNHSHSKNMAFNLAKGEIVCNINADHYIGKGFDEYLEEEFSKADSSIVITPLSTKRLANSDVPTDVLGKVCVLKSDFLRVTGFDERFINYGFEDMDFINRLEFAGVKRILLKDYRFLNHITHSHDERYELKQDGIKEFYIHYVSASESSLLFLKDDGTYEKTNVIRNSTLYSENYKYAYKKRIFKYEDGIRDLFWEHGVWNKNKENIILSNDDSKTVLTNGTSSLHHFLRDKKNNIFYQITNNETIQQLIKFRFFMTGRLIMERNELEKLTAVNKIGFGKGLVYFNGDLNEKIFIT